jgi:hypothetical protein
MPPKDLPPELEAIVNQALGITDLGPGLEDEFQMLESQAPHEEMQTPGEQELDLMSTFLSPQMGFGVHGEGENLGIFEKGWNPMRGMPQEVERGVFATPGTQQDPYLQESLQDFLSKLLSVRGQAPMDPSAPRKFPESPVPPGLENRLRKAGGWPF